MQVGACFYPPPNCLQKIFAWHTDKFVVQLSEQDSDIIWVLFMGGGQISHKKYK